MNRFLPHPSPPLGGYVFTVAAGILPAVEPGILPGGYSCGFRRQFLAQSHRSGRQDAALYGSQDSRRYTRAHHGKHIHWGM